MFGDLDSLLQVYGLFMDALEEPKDEVLRKLLVGSHLASACNDFLPAVGLEERYIVFFLAYPDLLYDSHAPGE